MTPEQTLEAPPRTRTSVVIVSFNREVLLRLSLEALSGAGHQVVVVDNGSMDGSTAVAEEFPGVRLMRLPKNFGLTKALNIGLRAADGEYILCLHDDVQISGDAVTKLADFLEARADVGAVCPLLTDEEGSPVAQVRKLPSPGHPDPPLGPAEGDADEIATECVSGAAIMFRSFFLRSTLRLDERYGQYGSVIEICAQMRRAGKKVVVLRAATAIHYQPGMLAPEGELAADRTSGTAVFLGKHYGMVSGILYRLKTALGGLFTLRFSVLNGALSGQKIDGTR